MDEELVGGACGVGPDVIEQGEVVVELDAVVGEFLLHALCGADGECHAVDADGLSGGDVLGEPVYEVDGVGAVFGHHGEAGATELFGGLDEVSGIGPAEGVGGSDDGGAVGAVLAHEAGEPLAAAPVGGRVLALVGVCAADHDGVDAVLFHGLAQCLQVLWVLLFHSMGFMV